MKSCIILLKVNFSLRSTSCRNGNNYIVALHQGRHMFQADRMIHAEEHLQDKSKEQKDRPITTLPRQAVLN